MRFSRSCRCPLACPWLAWGSTTPATRRSWRHRSSWHDRRGMIPRYTRPELGRLWTDEARMESWRAVELAACEELPELLGADTGPTAEELEAIRAASFTVEAVRG